MFSRLTKELLYLSWTLGGTGLVLITLSSNTLRWGIWISGIALFTHLLGVAIDYWSDRNE
jgi:hypothetical protein